MDYLKYNLKKGYRKIYSLYELNNHLMTLGLDIYWRKKVTDIMNKHLIETNYYNNIKKFVYCDFCIGTGEFFDEMVKRVKKDIDKLEKKLFVGLDFSFDMISLAKLKKVYKEENVFFILADVGLLPFRDESVDIVSISLGVRNLRNSNDGKKDEQIFIKRFKEIYRVIRLGGYFCGLETSRPPNRIIRRISDFFTMYISTNIAKIVSGDFETYTYLAKSMLDFYDADNFKNFLLNIGFEKVNYYLFTFGVVALHLAQK